MSISSMALELFCITTQNTFIIVIFMVCLMLRNVFLYPDCKQLPWNICAKLEFVKIMPVFCPCGKRQTKKTHLFKSFAHCRINRHLKSVSCKKSCLENILKILLKFFLRYLKRSPLFSKFASLDMYPFKMISSP